MNSKSAAARWCIGFVAIILPVAATIAAVNVAIDPYGLFRDPTGRRLIGHSSERTSKYLFSLRYIPANFDGILIGTSLTDNWNVTRISGSHIYNVSLNGGNISEEKVIAGNVFAVGRIRTAIFCIHPFLTATHGLKSTEMNPRVYLGALGSVELLKEYAHEVLQSAGLENSYFDANGRYSYEPPEAEARVFQINPMNAKRAKAIDIDIDEAAVAEYAQLLDMARARGARIVAFIPPMYAPFYAERKARYDSYFARMSALFRPDEKIINFNVAPYASYNANPANFMDGYHLTAKAAEYFSTELGARLGS